MHIDDRLSVAQNFIITSAKVSQNQLDANSLLQPSASSPDDSAHLLVLRVAFPTLSASIEVNLIGYTPSGLSGNNTSGSAMCLGGCYCFNCCNVFSVRGRIQFFMLSVSTSIALWTLALLISRLNSFDILLMVDVILVVFRHF